jgi:hypothetical protein
MALTIFGPEFRAVRVCREEAGPSERFGNRAANQFSTGGAENSTEVFEMKVAMAFLVLFLCATASGIAAPQSPDTTNSNPTSNQITDGRLEIFAQERKATLAEIRALPENPQDAEIVARVRRLKEDLSALDREIARVRSPNSVIPIPRSPTQMGGGVRAPHGAIPTATQINAGAGKASFPGWDVFRNFPSKEIE